jgi:hypothetical protein
MKRQYVEFPESGHIKSALHVANTLFVEFEGARIYRADNVPVGWFDLFRKAESPGKFYNSKLKSEFVFSKVV